MTNIQIKKLEEKDRQWAIELIKEEWASNIIITLRKVHDASILSGLVALYGKVRSGLLTYHFENNECEIVTLNSINENIGIGTALLREIEILARSNKCTRLWVITTNDNTDALRFYQMRGFIIKAIYCNIIKESRQLKPEIPYLGLNDIEIRDQIELEKLLE